MTTNLSVHSLVSFSLNDFLNVTSSFKKVTLDNFNINQDVMVLCNNIILFYDSFCVITRAPREWQSLIYIH